jgi:hypothetical protein
MLFSLPKRRSHFNLNFLPTSYLPHFESFRRNELFFEGVVTEDYDSYEKAKFDESPGG